MMAPASVATIAPERATPDRLALNRTAQRGAIMRSILTLFILLFAFASSRV